MPFPDELNSRLVEWGKAAFARELDTGFKQARIFDSRWAEVEFATLETFAPEDLRVLAELLPTRKPENPELQKTMSDRERGLIETLNQTFARILTERKKEIAERTMSIFDSPLKEEIKRMQLVAKEKLKALAKQWDCEIRKVDAATWRLYRLERWGKLFIFFDFSDRIELSYFINIEDNDYRDVVEHDSYLGRLGLRSGSRCTVTTAEMCEEKIPRMAEIVNWQVDEYSKIIESLDWPR